MTLTPLRSAGMAEPFNMLFAEIAAAAAADVLARRIQRAASRTTHSTRGALPRVAIGGRRGCLVPCNKPQERRFDCPHCFLSKHHTRGG